MSSPPFFDSFPFTPAEKPPSEKGRFEAITFTGFAVSRSDNGFAITAAQHLKSGAPKTLFAIHVNTNGEGASISFHPPERQDVSPDEAMRIARLNAASVLSAIRAQSLLERSVGFAHANAVIDFIETTHGSKITRIERLLPRKEKPDVVVSEEPVRTQRWARAASIAATAASILTLGLYSRPEV